MDDSLKSLVSYIKQLYFVRASNEASIDGSQLVEMIRAVKHVFSFISVESVRAEITIAYIGDASDFSSITEHDFSANSCDELAFRFVNRDSDCTIFLDDDYNIKFFHKKIADLKYEKLVHIGYQLVSHGDEYILHGGDKIFIHKVPGSSRAIFPKWDLTTLLEKLSDYEIESASRSTCKILEQCWHDESRLLFKPSPEHFMRDSILQFLRNTIGKYAYIKTEQNTDDSHPVDLKVEFHGTNRRVLIEVKWLGASVAADGVSIGTTYKDARAKSGAKQLCEYLENEKDATPRTELYGVLVVFDGRRKGLKKAGVLLCREDGFHYQKRDINFSPEYSEKRKDFAKPLRFFIEPRTLA